jgi:hypothetical protein
LEENIMGDRKISIKVCPKCGKNYNVYDAPSSMMYVAKCKCGFDERLSYILIGNDTYYLIPTDVDELIEELKSDLSESREHEDYLSFSIENLESQISDLTEQISLLSPSL